jgi:hypothetical protein
VKCQRCGRALVRFAIEIPTKDGPIGWGPKCAEYVTVKPTRMPFPVVERAAPKLRARPVDPLQPELPLEVA